MFMKINEFSRGKHFAFIPDSFRALEGYFEIGKPATTEAYYLGAAGYWKAIEKGVPTTSFGIFEILTYIPEDSLPVYKLPNGDTEFWRDRLITYEEWKTLGATGPRETNGRLRGPRVSTNLAFKLGNRTAYSNPEYAKRSFPDLEDFYDPDFHTALHSVDISYPLPDMLDGWFKWSEKS